MSYIPGISAQKESKHPFLTTGFLIVSDNPGEEKSRTEAFGAGVPGFGDKRAVFLRKEVGIYPKRRKHLPKTSLCFRNIFYCFPEYLPLLFKIRSKRNILSSGYKRRQSFPKWQKAGIQLHTRNLLTPKTFPLSYCSQTIKILRNTSSNASSRMRFFIQASAHVRNKRFWRAPIIKVTEWYQAPPRHWNDANSRYSSLFESTLLYYFK